MINSISIDYKIPLITGAAIKFEGQVATFRNDIDNMPCYRCLYQDLPDISPSCLDSGILGDATGLVGTILATECMANSYAILENIESKLMLLI